MRRLGRPPKRCNGVICGPSHVGTAVRSRTPRWPRRRQKAAVVRNSCRTSHRFKWRRWVWASTCKSVAPHPPPGVKWVGDVMCLLRSTRARATGLRCRASAVKTSRVEWNSRPDRIRGLGRCCSRPPASSNCEVAWMRLQPAFSMSAQAFASEPPASMPRHASSTT